MTQRGTPRLVSERTIRRECAACGTALTYAGTGRPPRYCSASCRQHGWAIRAAERALGTAADTRPAVVHEVSERVMKVSTGPARPTTGREWADAVNELTAQLHDSAMPVAAQHWHHARLYDALVAAVAALGRAHPGGLDQLTHR